MPIIHGASRVVVLEVARESAPRPKNGWGRKGPESEKGRSFTQENPRWETQGEVAQRERKREIKEGAEDICQKKPKVILRRQKKNI